MRRLALLLCLAACPKGPAFTVADQQKIGCPGTMKPDGIGGCRAGPSPDAARCWRPDAGLPDAGTICWADGQPTEDGCRALGMAWSGTGCLVEPPLGDPSGIVEMERRYLDNHPEVEKHPRCWWFDPAGKAGYCELADGGKGWFGIVDLASCQEFAQQLSERCRDWR